MDLKLNIDLSHDASDELFMQLLLEGYETSYWCYLDSLEKMNSRLQEGKDYDWIEQELIDNEEVLAAYERLARHYTAHESGEKNCRRIREGLDSKRRIAKGMSQ